MYQVILARSAEKDLKIIEERFKKRILKIILNLQNNPFVGKKLDGEFKNYYSVRVGAYRIIYEIKKKQLIIYVIRVKGRKDVYK